MTEDERIELIRTRLDKVTAWAYPILTILIIAGLIFATAVMTNKI